MNKIFTAFVALLSVSMSAYAIDASPDLTSLSINGNTGGGLNLGGSNPTVGPVANPAPAADATTDAAATTDPDKQATELSIERSQDEKKKSECDKATKESKDLEDKADATDAEKADAKAKLDKACTVDPMLKGDPTKSGKADTQEALGPVRTDTPDLTDKDTALTAATDDSNRDVRIGGELGDIVLPQITDNQAVDLSAYEVKDAAQADQYKAAFAEAAAAQQNEPDPSQVFADKWNSLPASNDPNTAYKDLTDVAGKLNVSAEDMSQAEARMTASKAATDLLESGYWPTSKEDRIAVAVQYLREKGYSDEVIAEVVNVVNKENASWDPTLCNKTSSACGLGQYINGTWNSAASKTLGTTAGRWDPQAQLDVLAADINSRYQQYNAGTLTCHGTSFAACDYVYHYAGSWDLSHPERIQYALNYTAQRASSGANAYANAVSTLDGVDVGTVLASMPVAQTTAGTYSSGGSTTTASTGSTSSYSSGLLINNPYIASTTSGSSSGSLSSLLAAYLNNNTIGTATATAANTGSSQTTSSGTHSYDSLVNGTTTTTSSCKNTVVTEKTSTTKADDGSTVTTTTKETTCQDS